MSDMDAHGLLDRVGIDADDDERRGRILLDLREIRQGSRDLVKVN